MRYDVFISCKSEDYYLGREVYDFLANYRGFNLSIFLADRELRKLGIADYGRAIDDALDSSSHLIVVSSDVNYLKAETSPYVYYEWHTFAEEIRSGRKKGNMMTILTSNIVMHELPLALRNCQSFPIADYGQIVTYLVNPEDKELTSKSCAIPKLPEIQLSDDIEDDLDYDDAVDFMKDGELQDAIHSLQASYENGNVKAISLFNKILFQNFGNIDWDDETWDFFEQQVKAEQSFAYLAFFYRLLKNKETHLEAAKYIKAARNDSTNGYAFLCEGIAREKGIGMRPNLRSAMKRYEEAYKMKVYEACSYLAEMYLNGNSGVEIDENKALSILEEGCKLKDPRSYYVLAKIYSMNLKQSGNFEKAEELYLEAAYYRMYESWIALGKMYQDNIYIGNRWDKAKECYIEAITNGVKDGHAYLARLYWKQQRYEDALIEAERGVKNGSFLSLSVLGEIYEEGMPDVDKLIVVQEPDFSKAWQYYKKAFELGGRVEDAISLARLYVKEDFRPDDISWEIIEGYLNEGAKVPLREAIELMVKALRINGREEDALKYIKIGAESGMLDMMYEYGIRALSTNTGGALKLLSNAASKGHIPSIEKMLEYYKTNGIKAEYDKYMDIALKFNVDVPVEDFAEFLYLNRSSELWLYLKNIYLNQSNYSALYWMAYYMLHNLQIDETEQKWLCETYIEQFNNVSSIATSSYDLFAKIICLKNSTDDFDKDLDHVHEKYRDYIRSWKLVHNISNMSDGEVLMTAIRHKTKQNPQALNNEWLQKYNVLSQKAFTKGVQIMIIGDNQEQVLYLKDILSFYDFNVSYSLNQNIVSSIETQNFGTLLVYLILANGKSEIPQTIVHEHSIVTYIDLENELYDASGSVGKTKAIKEELIANRINAFIYNLAIRNKVNKVVENQQEKVILHCEEEPSNHGLLEIVLAKRYKVLWAKNGIEAIAICEENHVDLIYMDIRMPEMNGLDATRIIKEIHPEIPIVALSAYAFEENVAEARRAGMDDFMAKPFRVEVLLECTRRYIG